MKLTPDILPAHVAIIMDGNGRWAQTHSRPRLWGHKKGVDSVRAVVEAAGELGLQVLSLYAFSEENWNRSPAEVKGIMELLETYIVKERENLNKNNVQLRVIGCLEKLPVLVRKKVMETSHYLSKNTGLILNIALSYGGRNEIVAACKDIAAKVRNNEVSVDEINVDMVSNHLWTKGLCDPDLLIRTSGEQRLSNFLLWQMAYTEFWFTPVFWPDFKKEHLLEALSFYSQRQRRFGRVPEFNSESATSG